MKKLKRAVVFLLCFSIMLLGSSLTVFAASGEMWFTDPSTTVGATVEITANFKADSNVSSLETELTYDTSLLKFISGEGATENSGKINLLNTANGSSKEFSYSMKFQALAEGTAKVEIASIQATASNGAALQVVEGNSTVSIGEGDPALIQNGESTAQSSGIQVTVDGKSYTILNDFSEILIPDGFKKTELSFEGQTCQATIQESSGKYAIYLESPEKEAEFFLYNPEDGVFSPFRQISISQDRYIILLNEEKKNSDFPEYLQKTSLTIEGAEFPAWQNVDKNEYYVVYALNSDGKSGYYQYDTVDSTYQRFVPEKVEKEVAPTSFFGKFNEILKEHLDKVLIGAWAVFLLMLIILIVVSVKLRHRNNELDDLYEEYGIDEEDEEPLAVERKKSQPTFKKRTDTAFLPKHKDEDDFYDFEDEDEEFDEEDEYDEYEEEVVETPKRASNKSTKSPSVQPKRENRGHIEEDDAFKVDFIDLD